MFGYHSKLYIPIECILCGTKFLLPRCHVFLDGCDGLLDLFWGGEWGQLSWYVQDRVVDLCQSLNRILFRCIRHVLSFADAQQIRLPICILLVAPCCKFYIDWNNLYSSFCFQL